MAWVSTISHREKTNINIHPTLERTSNYMYVGASRNLIRAHDAECGVSVPTISCATPMACATLANAESASPNGEQGSRWGSAFGKRHAFAPAMRPFVLIAPPPRSYLARVKSANTIVASYLSPVADAASCARNLSCWHNFCAGGLAACRTIARAIECSSASKWPRHIYANHDSTPADSIQTVQRT